MRRAKVIVLTTGGTIAHRSKPGQPAVMDFEPSVLVAGGGQSEVELEFRSILRKGSMDIGPVDWRVIADATIAALRELPAGVVILHGTDTMHYTGAALSFMLQDLSVPIVLTGSMIPGGNPNSDAPYNLADAINVAANADLAEVCVVFSADEHRRSGAILRGNRARKMRSRAINAFASVNFPELGTVKGGKVTLTETSAVRPRAARQLQVAMKLATDVVLIKLTPATTAETFRRQLEGAAGAVIEGTGVGHITTELQPIISAFERPVLISTQAIYGGEHLGVYDVDARILALANAIPGGDMTSETALVKLMWALAQGGDIGVVMRSNVAGEIGREQPPGWRNRRQANDTKGKGQ